LWGLAAAAQQRKAKNVGVLVRAAPGWQQFWELFRQDLHELGYVEGENIPYQFRSDEGEIRRLPELARELVKLKVDLIVTWFTPAATAAAEATHNIPIICAICGDLVGTGLVKSLARPGGNLTGSSSLTAELSAKFVDLILEISPSAHRVAVLANAPDPFSKVLLKQVRSAGQGTGMAIEPIMSESREDLDAAFSSMQKSRPDAIIVQPFAVEAEMYRAAAALVVDRVLKGSSPAELPVEQPTRFELLINLKTAKAINLAIPPNLLARADEVIE